MSEHVRRLPWGAEPVAGGGVHFRVWAPGARELALVLDPRSDASVRGGASGAAERPMDPEGDGWFALLHPEAAPGSLYGFRPDGGERILADPASRFQPDGPLGPSQVVDPSPFPWTDDGWGGLLPQGQVLYELHVGTFTEEGTFAAAERRLPGLAELGVTALELMPVADFCGNFGWGYDGVCLFAPTRLYGPPDDFRRFVDAAHRLGLGVILDVVCNHLGPAGNVLPELAPAFFSLKHRTDWGDAPDFDGPSAGPVRQFYVANAVHWVTEYHLDGFRFDATQDIHDDSADPILAEIVRESRRAAGRRRLLMVGENEPQDVDLARPQESGGQGLDALWNDDLHHSAVVALTGRSEAYYSDYRGTAAELLAAARHGFLYQGQWYGWQGKRRGSPALDLPSHAFVGFLENHDQVANSPEGRRLHELSAPGAWRAMTTLLLLGPWTPMLFQGQEQSSPAPFLFFADHRDKLAVDVRRGRAEFLKQFRSYALPAVQRALPDPGDPDTFRRSKLPDPEGPDAERSLLLHGDLLALRRADPVLRAADRNEVDGAVLADDAFLLRWFAADGLDRLLVLNLGGDLELRPCPQPLLAPPAGARWRLAWTSEHPRYGGRGAPSPEVQGEWRLPGRSASLLAADALAGGEPQPG